MCGLAGDGDEHFVAVGAEGCLASAEVVVESAFEALAVGVGQLGVVAVEVGVFEEVLVAQL